MSSHVLDEVERFGCRVLVMAQGRLAAEGDFRAIRDLMDDRPHRIRVRSDRPARAWPPACSARPASSACSLDGDDATHRRHRRRPRSCAGRSPWSPASVGARLYEVAPLDDDLESVFRYLVEGR